MKTLVFCLLLASLTMASVHSAGTYRKFQMQHTYNGNTLVDCENHLNPVLRRLNMGCKSCNTVILGDQRYATDMNEVTDICRLGTFVRGNLYRSHRSFRVVTCWEIISNNQPPNCKYIKVNQWNIQSKYITVACENMLPVHFEGC